MHRLSGLLTLLLFIAGSTLVVLFYQRATVEILFADYHKALPAIDATLNGRFAWSFFNFQSAGHLNPWLMGVCLCNAYLLGSSTFAELILCLLMIGVALSILVRRSTTDQHDSTTVVLFSLGLALVLYNLNKWEHFIFPFTGIEYFTTLAIFPVFAHAAARVAEGKVIRSRWNIAVFLFLLGATILGCSGGRGPIMGATFALFGLTLYTKPSLFGGRVSRYLSATLTISAALDVAIYSALLESSPVTRTSFTLASAINFGQFYLNLFASWLLGNGLIGRLHPNHPIWIYGLVIFLFLIYVVASNPRCRPFAIILASFAIIGTLSITLARFNYGPDYAKTSKYLPIVDFLAIAALVSEASRPCGDRNRASSLRRAVFATILVGSFASSCVIEREIAPYRKQLFTGISKYYFAPTFFSEYSRHIAPEPRTAAESARIIRDNWLSSAKRPDLWYLSEFNSVEGLAGDGPFKSVTQNCARFFLYKPGYRQIAIIGLSSDLDHSLGISISVNGSHQSLILAQGLNMVSIPLNRPNGEFEVMLPIEAVGHTRIFAFLE